MGSEVGLVVEEEALGAVFGEADAGVLFGWVGGGLGVHGVEKYGF